MKKGGENMKRKKTISLVSALIMAGMQLMATTQAYALQTTFASDLSASCGYRNGDVVDTEVVNFLAVAQQYSPKGTILSWNNPDDSDAESIKLFKNGVQIELTQVEFQIVEFFFTNAGKALSRTDILKEVWGESYFGDEKVVDVNIRRLRMKIEDEPSIPKHLVTVWGMGYKWL